MSDVAGSDPIVEIIRAMMDEGRSGAEIGRAVEDYIEEQRRARYGRSPRKPSHPSATKHLRRHDKEWWALRRQVFHRDAHICQYCGDDVGDTPHCDHFIPLARGGTHDISNLVTACAFCNTSKGAKLYEEWVGGK